MCEIESLHKLNEDIGPRREALRAMINKLNKTTFTKWDIHLVQIFSVFAGITLENAKPYHESITLTAQIRGFFDISFSLLNSESIHPILSDIIHNTRVSIEANGAVLFILDKEINILTLYIADQCTQLTIISYSKGTISIAITTKKTLIINNATEDSRMDKHIYEESGQTSESILIAPLTKSAGDVISVVILPNKADNNFTSKDSEIVQSFAQFASVVLENSKLKNISQSGSVEVELQQFISEAEQRVAETLINFQLTEEQHSEALSLSFFSLD
jgi:GAF domain-containing protein